MRINTNFSYSTSSLKTCSLLFSSGSGHYIGDLSGSYTSLPGLDLVVKQLPRSGSRKSPSSPSFPSGVHFLKSRPGLKRKLGSAPFIPLDPRPVFCAVRLVGYIAHTRNPCPLPDTAASSNPSPRAGSAVCHAALSCHCSTSSYVHRSGRGLPRRFSGSVDFSSMPWTAPAPMLLAIMDPCRSVPCSGVHSSPSLPVATFGIAASNAV